MFAYFQWHNPEYMLKRHVKHILVHPSFDDFTLENDISILTLDYPIHYSSVIEPINLPHHHHDYTGMNVTAIGWGQLNRGKSTKIFFVL